MEENTTVEMGGVTFDADNLEAALDALPNTTDGCVLVGDVFVAGDGYETDGDLYLAHKDDVINGVSGMEFDAEEYTRESTWGIRWAIDEARSTDTTVEYVERLVLNVNDVMREEESTNCDYGDVVIEHEGAYFTEGEMATLDEEEAITISKVGRNPAEGVVYVALRVDEDEL